MDETELNGQPALAAVIEITSRRPQNPKPAPLPVEGEHPIETARRLLMQCADEEESDAVAYGLRAVASALPERPSRFAQSVPAPLASAGDMTHGGKP